MELYQKLSTMKKAWRILQMVIYHTYFITTESTGVVK